MTQQISELMATAGDRATAVLDGIEDAQLGAPTPCAEYDVRALVNHLLQVVVQFQALAAKQPADFSATPDHVAEDPEWRKRFAVEVRRLAQAWAEPGALEGPTGMMGMPAPTVARMALGDLVVHAWDLAQATGQTYVPDPDTVADVAPAFAELAPGGRQMGVFGAPVDVAEHVSPLDALLALTGRDPHWAPR
ncbi:TIGR03086 family metal-binding protein [Streptomyces sp. N35]|uniref:TIGR03086 family metal-binding protein n=1 Tax=Streptomyces sp. N35 TaxID=2795730 RepID=UPI0018F3357D|nr:TIGR03086 family metal-binding protein [Streptomyces sp. N35]